ncbi:MAG: hypothetical protein N2035_08990 [Chthoniobacterales bacterium]|nr:hypothetical protein [Chthoniobacterales bacterium]
MEQVFPTVPQSAYWLEGFTDAQMGIVEEGVLGINGPANDSRFSAWDVGLLSNRNR